MTWRNRYWRVGKLFVGLITAPSGRPHALRVMWGSRTLIDWMPRP